MTHRVERQARLVELAAVFLKLGTIGFGGPAAHIALMEDEVVGRRRWLSRAEFLDLVGATNLIPGPNSTELAIHLGRRRAGVPGLLVAGVSFILPAVVIVTTIAWLYQRGRTFPVTGALLSGITPVVLAIVARALWRLRDAMVKNRLVAVVTVAVFATTLIFPQHEVALLVAAGALSAIVSRTRLTVRSGPPAAGGFAGLAVAVPIAAVAGPVTLPSLFLVFLKAGSLLFGSGYVLLAFLRADLVERLGWLTNAELLDAIAVGQVTPGPVFTTATFIGYGLAGFPGAAIATLGIFLPAFVFVAASAPFLGALRRSPTLGVALDGVNAASLALMAAVLVQLAGSALVDVPAVALAAIAFVLLSRNVNPTWIVVGGGVVGWLGWLGKV